MPEDDAVEDGTDDLFLFRIEFGNGFELKFQLVTLTDAKASGRETLNMVPSMAPRPTAHSDQASYNSTLGPILLVSWLFSDRGSQMAELERRVSTLEDQMAHVVATLDVLATNQNHLDEALATLADAQINLTDAQIRTQEQFRDTDARISNLTSAIGQLIAEMRSKAN